jgi:hypothetical protein
MEELAQDSSSVKPLGLLFIVCMGVLTFSLKRRYALMPLLITTAYMPLGQVFVVLGLHFQFFRILLLLGVCRVWMRREAADMERTPLDKIFLWWAAATVVMGTMASPSVDRFINRSGEAFNGVGAYFLFRCWIKNVEDMVRVVRLLAIMIVPLAISMAVEKFTTHNIFSVFGGVPEITGEREGKLRCQGAFRHPILAGTYAATLFPICVGLWFVRGGNKLIPILGVCGAAVATVAAASSGALLAMIGTVIGLALWPIRCHMAKVRWGFLLTIIALAFIMKAPVWYLFARVSELTGGTGWHRSYLIDQAVGHFNEWWLFGSTYTAHWAPEGQVLVADPSNMDITNNYIAEGLGGGMMKLGLFLALIVKCFSSVGRWTNKADASPYSRRFLIWALGVSLFGHCVSFMSVAYFDQIVVMWYWLLATMSMLGAERLSLVHAESLPNLELASTAEADAELA